MHPIRPIHRPIGLTPLDLTKGFERHKLLPRRLQDALCPRSHKHHRSLADNLLLSPDFHPAFSPGDNEDAWPLYAFKGCLGALLQQVRLDDGEFFDGRVVEY